MLGGEVGAEGDQQADQGLGTGVLGAGVTQLFEKGMMFFSTETGAHALTGQKLASFNRRGGVDKLGFPTRDGIG